MSDLNWSEILRENLIAFLIGTVLLGVAFDFLRRGIDRFFFNRGFYGWKLHVIPNDPKRPAYTHDLLWDEVRRFEESRFEKRKFIQSVCTSEGLRIRAGEVKTDDPAKWFYRDEGEKTYRFDLTKFDFGDVPAQKDG